MPLAISIAKRLSRRTATLCEELESDAFLGLCEASEKFDPRYEWPAFARTIIEGRIRNGEKIRRGTQATVALPDDLLDGSAGPAERAEAADAVEFVRRNLPKRKFARPGDADLSRSAIAKRAGVDASVASRRMAAARRLLKEIAKRNSKCP